MVPPCIICVSIVLISDADVKANDTVSPKNGGEVESDVALVGEEFVVCAGAEILRGFGSIATVMGGRVVWIIYYL